MSIDLARRLGHALDVRSETRIRTIDSALQAYVRLTRQSPTTAPSAHNHAASEITSGTFADARIAQSNVTQHEAALNIDWGQVINEPATFPPSNHITSGTWTPVDASGAGLALTIAGASYSKHESIVIARAYLTYPANASGASAIIGGLPFTVANDDAARQGFVTYSTLGAGMYALPNKNTQNIHIQDLGGSARTNVQLSGVIIAFTAFYTV